MGPLILLALACSEPPRGDAARYHEVIAQPELAPEEALAICASLSGESVRGDCALAVASRASPPGAWCPRVAAGVWRQECYFEAAESLRRTGRSRDAVALCLESGPFRDDCGQHLWQTPLHALLGGGGTERFSQTLPRAWALYREWEPLLGEITDFRHRFWRRYYEDGFEASPPPVSLAVCETLDQEADRERCRRYGAGVQQMRQNHF